jgi:hypothetical protein
MAHLLDDDLGEPLAPARVNIGSAKVQKRRKAERG